MASDLTLTCTLATPEVAPTAQPRLVYALIEVGGGQGAQALPLNLGLVLDCSNSMRIRMVTDAQFEALARAGQSVEVVTDGVPAWQISDIPPEQAASFPRRIDYVRDALRVARDQIRATDRFAVVAFAAQAMTLIPPTSGADRQALVLAADQLERLQLGDETRMADGLALGFQAVQAAIGPGISSRLVVLTDGFTRHASQCYEWARQARQAGVLLSTLGIGVEFNEELLIPLAEATGGNAYFIERPEQIVTAFRQELGAALAVTCRNVEVKLGLTPGVELRRVSRVLPLIGAFDPGPDLGGSYALPLGDYDPAAPPALLVELVVPPCEPGIFRAAQALLAWDDPARGGLRANVRQDVVLRVAASGAAAAPPNARVVSIVDKVGAFTLGTRALADAAQGDVGAATLRLRQAATRLLDMGEPELAGEMARQAQALETSGRLDPNATKRLRYETRKITQRLA